MGLGKKMLKGAWNFTTMDNLTPETGGGITSAIISKQINRRGAAIFGAGIALSGIAKSALEARNRRVMGYTTYQDGLARMTSSYTTGVVPAMKRASQGDYQAFAGLAEGVVRSPGLSHIDDFGANPAMISALYNMGGR